MTIAPKIVGLDGKAVTEAVPKETPLSTLKALVDQIERGELTLESILIIGTKPNPADPSLVSHPTWDSGLRAAEAVFMLEVAKCNLLDMLRR